MLQKYFKEYTCFQNQLRLTQVSFLKNQGFLINLELAPLYVLSKDSKGNFSFSAFNFSYYLAGTGLLLIGDYKYFTRLDTLEFSFLDKNFNSLYTLTITDPLENKYYDLPNNDYSYIRCKLLTPNFTRGMISYDSCWQTILNQINPHLKSYNQKKDGIYSSYFKKLLLRRLKLWGRSDIPEYVSTPWVFEIYSLDWLYEISYSHTFMFNTTNRELLITTYIETCINKAESEYQIKKLNHFINTNTPYIINEFSYKRFWFKLLKKYLKVKLIFNKKPFKLSV